MILSHLMLNQQPPSATASVSEENQLDLTKEEGASFMDAWSEEDIEAKDVEDVVAPVKFEVESDVVEEETVALPDITKPIAEGSEARRAQPSGEAPPQETGDMQSRPQPEKGLELGDGFGNSETELPFGTTPFLAKSSEDAGSLQTAVNADVEVPERAPLESSTLEAKSPKLMTPDKAEMTPDKAEAAIMAPPSDGVMPILARGAEPSEIVDKSIKTDTVIGELTEINAVQTPSPRGEIERKSSDEIEIETENLTVDKAKQALSEPEVILLRNAKEATINAVQTVPVAALNDASQTPLPLHSSETAVLFDRTDPLFSEGGNHDMGLSQTVMTQLSTSGLVAAGTVRTGHPTVVQQIAAALSQSSGQSTQIALNPEELGRVRISVVSSEAGLVVNIVAERPETADMMRRNIDSLLQDFSDLGYENPTFDFQDDGNREEDNTSDTLAQTSDGMTAEVSLNAPLSSTPRMTASGGLDLKL